MRRLRGSKGDLAFLEGPHLVTEALAAGLALREVFADPAFLAEDPEGRALARELARRGQAVEAVAPELLASLADADSPRGLIAVAELPRGGLRGLPCPADALWVFADGLQDPGNLGALARVAEAAGGHGLALAPGSVHPNHPRALRASAGSLLRLAVAVGVTAEEVASHFPTATWVALTPHGGAPLWQAPLEGPLVLALGAEGPGLSPAVAARAAVRVTIPLAPPVESLNATVAAALVLFEIRRRRLTLGTTG